MRLRQLAENIYFFPGAFFMFYIVRGREKTALLELGISQLVSQVAHDYRENFEGESMPDLLVALHGHFDHAGAASRWKKELPAAELAGAQAASDTLSDPDMMPGYRRSMESSSANPFFKDVFPHSEDEVFLEPVVFDTILKDGDTIDLGGEILEIYETPGHSKCSLSVYHPGSKTCFASDACGLPLPNGRIWPTSFLDRRMYEDSIGRLKGLDIENLCMGHTMPYRGARKIDRLLDKNLEAVDGFYKLTERLWKEKGDRRAVLDELYREYAGDGLPAIGWVLKYGNKEMARQVIDNEPGRG